MEPAWSEMQISLEPARSVGCRGLRLRRLKRTQRVARPLDEVFEFFADPSNLEALTPPFLRFRILTPGPIDVRAGTRIDYRLSLFGVPIRWRTHISDWQPGIGFVDEQEAGPFAVWCHRHEFETDGSFVLIRDIVEYVEPLGFVGWVAHRLFVKRMLDRIFDFRSEAIRHLFERHRATSRSGSMETTQIHDAP